MSEQKEFLKNGIELLRKLVEKNEKQKRTNIKEFNIENLDELFLKGSFHEIPILSSTGSFVDD